MKQPFLRSYVELLIHTCHKRGIHAMGGMAAQIPIREDLQANQCAMEFVYEDKLREVKAGHDGTWVAHPGLVSVARGVFDAHMKGPNQIHMPAQIRSAITAKDLLEVPQGRITEFGFRRNVDVALQYIESWLRGNGCVPIYHLMEDAATAEISRAQLWQWIRYGAHTEDGGAITPERFEQVLGEILEEIPKTLRAKDRGSAKFERAGRLLRELSVGDFQEFLTTSAYQDLV